MVDYGGDIRNRHITTYFRKTIQLTEADLNTDQFILELLRDDGAIIYLNGTEIIRSNMPYTEVTNQTESMETVNGLAESTFFPYPLDNSLLKAGENILAVEIHQADPSSSDISFDLELYGQIIGGEPLVWEDKSYPLNMGGDVRLSAVFQSTGQCILPAQIDDDLTLSPECSPYLAQGNVWIGEHATLTIEPGVEIWMPEGASIYIEGVLKARGSVDNGIIIKLNPDHQPGAWGILSFRKTPAPSELSYLTIEDASSGPDPVKERGAISAFHADLTMDHLTIEQVYGDPVTARYSDIIMTNSTLHSEVTGDLINVKYGHARIENCRFTGNGEPDTDAIDYDEVEGGIIRNSLIHNFLGFNSDAIDIGEEATDVLIDSIFVYNITDKGVSVGQHSSVSIRNSIFVNCNMGVGAKDSARVVVDRSVFYNNVDGVASFEKNPGKAGGNVTIKNSILSNSSHAPYRADSKSTVRISYSLSDYEGLPDQSFNRYGNPLFANPTFFDFTLLSGSPALQAGSEGGLSVDMGSSWSAGDFEPSLMIARFYINGDNLDLPEFVGLYNPSGNRVDVSGYKITKGITAIVPEGTFLGAGSYLYFTDDHSAPAWEGMRYPVFPWESGRLSNDGEAIQLEDQYGIVIDHLVYENDGSWPQQGFTGEDFFELIRPGLDNHFPESWELKSMNQLVSTPKAPGLESFSIYPNPTHDIIHILAPGNAYKMVGVYDLSGHKLGEASINGQGETSLDLSAYPPGVLLIKAGSRVEKVVLLRH